MFLITVHSFLKMNIADLLRNVGMCRYGQFGDVNLQFRLFQKMQANVC